MNDPNTLSAPPSDQHVSRADRHPPTVLSDSDHREDRSPGAGSIGESEPEL